MSYEIVTGIKINELNKEIWIKGSSNNVFPKNFNWWKAPILSNILKEKGKQEAEIEILKAYEGGEFQAGVKNKYYKALRVLYYVYGEEYKNFNWRNNNFKYGSKEYIEFEEKRKSQEFKDLLLKALNYKISKKRYIIVKKPDNYYGKVNSTSISWRYNKEKATKFLFKEQAEENIYDSLKGCCEVQEVLK